MSLETCIHAKTVTFWWYCFRPWVCWLKAPGTGQGLYWLFLCSFFTSPNPSHDVLLKNVMLALPQLIVFNFILNDSILYSLCSSSPEITCCPIFPANFFFFFWDWLYVCQLQCLWHQVDINGRVTVPVSSVFIVWYLNSFRVLWGSRCEKWCGHLATVPLRTEKFGGFVQMIQCWT